MRSNFTMISPYVSITMIFKLWPVFVTLSILIYGRRRATTNYYYGKLSQQQHKINDKSDKKKNNVKKTAMGKLFPITA